MGYDVHISRRENWFDDRGPIITVSEFEAAVEHDPDLVLVPVPTDRNGDPQPIAELASDSQLRRESGLRWRAGKISSKNPSDLVIEAMCRLAKTLDARVQGDDGELYGDEQGPQQP
jgi:hypothetical protein